MNCELPPPVSNTTSDPSPSPSPDFAARYASRPSSSPGMTSTSTPECSRTAATKSALFAAMRSPAVPTAAIASTPSRPASPAIAVIAATVRSSGFSPSLPVSFRPSPRRVTSARSTMVRHSPSTLSSATWNLTEFVPTSTTAYRRAPNPTSDLSPRGRLTLRREPRPSSRTAAITRAGSSDSTAIVRLAPSSVRTSERSAMQPPTV